MQLSLTDGFTSPYPSVSFRLLRTKIRYVCSRGICISGSMFPLQANIPRVITFSFLIPGPRCRLSLCFFFFFINKLPSENVCVRACVRACVRVCVCVCVCVLQCLNSACLISTPPHPTPPPPPSQYTQTPATCHRVPRMQTIQIPSAKKSKLSTFFSSPSVKPAVVQNRFGWGRGSSVCRAPVS